MSKEVELLEYQHDFLTTKEKDCLILAGVGSGKSQAGAFFAINMFLQYPKSHGLIVANTHQQLINATIKCLSRTLEEMNIKHEVVSSGASKSIKTQYGSAYLYSLENYDNIRGIEVGWIWGDEVAFAKKEAMDVIRGRLRCKNGPLLERYTTSPNGYNWCYDRYNNPQSENIKLIKARTKDNIFLPEGYYESLLEEYGGIDSPLARQELFGDFVNLTDGAIYWGFSREENVKTCKLDNRFPVYVCLDFNISNMNGCYFQFIGDTFFVCRELVLESEGANTDLAARRICEDLQGFDKFIIPDSTAKAIKTSSGGRSDIEILRQYGLNVLHSHNPLVRDRQNTLNINYKNAKIFIDPSCRKLIRETETLASRDKEGDCAHVSVALGYGVYKLSPVRLKRPTSQGYQL